jgi:GNAT superfamily N-acetyltransferase
MAELLAPRHASAADITEIVRVTNAAFRVEDFFIDGDRTHVVDVESKMSGTRARFLVIDDPDGAGLMASAFVEIRGDRGYFGMLSVDPAHQKKGLGRTLFNAIEAHCRAAGCVALDISVVNLREELPAFYNMLGFTATGTAPLVSHTVKMDAHFVLMSKPLV